jgi:hypothetical protein
LSSSAFSGAKRVIYSARLGCGIAISAASNMAAGSVFMVFSPWCRGLYAALAFLAGADTNLMQDWFNGTFLVRLTIASTRESL